MQIYDVTDSITGTAVGFVGDIAAARYATVQQAIDDVQLHGHVGHIYDIRPNDFDSGLLFRLRGEKQA